MSTVKTIADSVEEVTLRKQADTILSYTVQKVTCYWRCTDKAVADYWSADNRRLKIGRLPINTKKLILLSYLSYLFRLRLLSEDSYLLEGLQSADETKMHPKAKLQNTPTFTGNGSHRSHVCLLLVIKVKTCT